MTKREYVGIGHRGKFVKLHRGYSDKKHTDVEWYRTAKRAEERYHQLSQNFGTASKPYLTSLKQMFCQHNWGKAPAFPEHTYYEFCYKCSKAHYRDNRTEEQLHEQKLKDEARRLEFHVQIEESRKEEERDYIKEAERELKDLKEGFENKWGEKA